MSLAEATWNSVNVVFAQLDLDVGPENVTHTAHQMGITAPLESVPAEAIGGLAVGVTPLEMADGYATLANGGVHHVATAISQVEFPSGKVDDRQADVHPAGTNVRSGVSGRSEQGRPDGRCTVISDPAKPGHAVRRYRGTARRGYIIALKSSQRWQEKMPETRVNCFAERG